MAVSGGVPEWEVEVVVERMVGGGFEARVVIEFDTGFLNKQQHGSRKVGHSQSSEGGVALCARFRSSSISSTILLSK